MEGVHQGRIIPCITDAFTMRECKGGNVARLHRSPPTAKAHFIRSYAREAISFNACSRIKKEGLFN